MGEGRKKGKELPDSTGENGCHSDSWPSLLSLVSQLLGRQGEGSRVDGAPRWPCRAPWGFPWLSERRPRRWRSLLALPDSREPSGQGCALECLCLCQGGRCLTPTHVLLRQRTRHPSPAIYTILKAGSTAPDPWPRCDAQPPGPGSSF